jgi:flagellar hook-associated protein 2
MGSISNSLSSTASTNTNSTSSGSGSGTSNPTGIFTGTSTYSQDFQNVINRAVAIASLPVNLLSAQQTALTDQANELKTLDTKFTALQKAVQGIGTALSGASFQATVSNDEVVSATLANGATEGVYSINVTEPGVYATSLSTATWDPTADSSGNLTTYTLKIGDNSNTFTPADNSAATVAATINAQYGTLVHATAVNLKTTDNPDWRVSLHNNNLGPETLDIEKGGVSLQTQQQPPGLEASYEVNNSGVTTSSDTRSVAVSNGVTLTIQGSGTANVTVTRSFSTLSTAVSSFVDAYNSVVTELDSQHGQSAGPLQGQSILTLLSQALSSISTFTSNSSGDIITLEDLGMKLETSGQITFNSYNLMSADFSNSQGVTAFLGSSADGGFLKVATDALDKLQNASTGFLKSAETANQTQLSNIGKDILDKTNQVEQLQIQMQTQLARADAAIAAMQQQYGYLTSMFSAMQTANQMYANG